MANNYSYTMVDTCIPIGAITEAELLLLSSIYDADTFEDYHSFHARFGVNECFDIDRSKILQVIDTTQQQLGSAQAILFQALLKADEGDDIIQVDCTNGQYNRVFQEIVSRCDALDAIVITSSWCSDKMRPHEFGGSIEIITATEIHAEDTQSFLERTLAEFDLKNY